LYIPYFNTLFRFALLTTPSLLLLLLLQLGPSKHPFQHLPPRRHALQFLPQHWSRQPKE